MEQKKSADKRKQPAPAKKNGLWALIRKKAESIEKK